MSHHDLWIRVCALLEVDPETVREPTVQEAPEALINVFGGWHAVYIPHANKILVLEDCGRGHLAHEFAEAVVYQSPKFTFKDTEDFAQWVEQNI
jgi:hypothetical protein